MTPRREREVYLQHLLETLYAGREMELDPTDLKDLQLFVEVVDYELRESGSAELGNRRVERVNLYRLNDVGRRYWERWVRENPPFVAVKEKLE